MLFFPFLWIKKRFKKTDQKRLVIQNAVIGDYANTSIIFEALAPFDMVLNKTNLAFANYDERVENKFIINDIKENKISKLGFALKLFNQNYSDVYVLTPNSLNLFLAKFTMAKNITTISHYNNSSSFKLLSCGMKKVNHSLRDLTLLTYLKMLNIGELKYEKCIQKPPFMPKNSIIKSDKFKIGISLSAGNKMKTPPNKTWLEILQIIDNFECEIYIFGVKGEEENLQNLQNINLKNSKIISLIDKISLQELPFYISQMNLYISSDTGNYYIADTMKVATICLMGPCFASEQRAVFNSLIINSNLPPISSVFKTVRNIDASKYFVLDENHKKSIFDFIKTLYQ